MPAQSDRPEKRPRQAIWGAERLERWNLPQFASDQRNGIRHRTPKKGGTAPINGDDWNTYGCERDADKVVFRVNGQPIHTYSRMPDKGEKQWPFNQPFYFILSMQIGGKWVNGSGPTNPAHYPAGMKVDWVRVYRRKTASGGTSDTSDFENGK